MDLQLKPKEPQELLPTDILFQTLYWARVKSRLGCRVMAFDIQPDLFSPAGDVLVLLQRYGPEMKSALVPQGPEFLPPKEEYGPFLESLSYELMHHLGPDTAFIRYDLPWESQYAREMQQGHWYGFPEPRLREMRMNMGTESWNLRKSSMDMTVASTLVVDLDPAEKDILGRMKSKTRYNIGLAGRRGVEVQTGSMEHLPAFYDLYLQTAARNGFATCAYEHFSAIFNAHIFDPCNSEVLFLLAACDQELLAGGIVAISGQTAHFLYGASSNTRRHLMGSYAVHWEAMRQSRLRGCLRYDMGAVSPGADPDHPFYGLYRFKSGFGGRLEMRSGSWDFPIDEEKYQAFINTDNLVRG
ncbi:Methicillin resistance protein [Desulfonatronospira thiodismutans ASO3-1]|uniref:Methicillin resistance protein n=1 Tax=Desulfonatronospira thiodismutans ASO3-1 TaxID=555779 RepID=D6SUK5_9BACT|nr:MULTISPECIES: peptidoglycan bridge formation glycyltransferase FemA/FemB family protein [Desulfonatronospira]EFI32985.1 Methicillin resistance protein [Desulfonatronospira thiodismutans ASO3-1]RQD74545.1 MAG: peptidoglycan bridge formation glycyltransferase FemA/FemB family protein [Desulfonatronospira sp. MSAO_Bac3]